MNVQRIQALLQALAVLASELGPEFIHSDHGSAMLSKAVTVLQTVSGVGGVVASTLAAQIAPHAATNAAPATPALQAAK